MFPESFKKFYSVLGVSLALGLGAMSFLSPGEGITGQVVTETVAAPTFAWPIFFFGLFVGGFAVGLVILLAHYEHQRL